MARFWVYVGDKVQGPIDIPSLRKVPGFNLLSQVCQEGEQTWRMADEVIEIKSYFISPPRPNSFALDAGNAAPKLDLDTKPVLEELTLPEPNIAWQKGAAPSKAGTPDLEILPAASGGVPPVQSGPNAGLRAVCEVCGYKNPRDVAVCMKCGEKLGGVPASVAESKPELKIPKPESVAPSIPAPAPAPAPAAAPEPDPAAAATVEISMGKLLMGCALAGAIAGGGFFGYRTWKKHHMPKVAPAPAPQPASSTSARRSKSSTKSAYRGYRYSGGYSSPTPSPRKKNIAPTENEAPAQETPEPKNDAVAYRVVAEATPLKKRFSSPINSPYAVKRRADTGLWSAQEDHAIQQVQHNRIYGGLRTLERNVEILMQILRDREYNTAFESGHRIYLYNDVDWSAVLKEGPVYEVRLTFSGGRDADGSPKKPLHFAFQSDLERGTVEPGGQDQIRSNTLHAFFDESRIAPEDRRAIAKDTEELVLAAQPDASPLALDTIVRQFAKVYTTAALSRVADAYDLTLVKKKLAHDTRLGSDDEPASAKTETPVLASAKKETETPVTTFGGRKVSPLKHMTPDSAADRAAQPKPLPPVSGVKGSVPEFRMETGAGRERTFMVRAGSKASVGKMWEVLTGYDRLKQFIPDMLASEREGQDGAATIVHTVYLTRFMIFMFKVNLHLRIIEHPREHTLDFERIAGEFESFRGSVELTQDPATHESVIAFHAVVVPSGRMANWALEPMARRLLVPQIEAIRAKAETN